jgi:hypothetical protein
MPMIQSGALWPIICTRTEFPFANPSSKSALMLAVANGTTRAFGDMTRVRDDPSL